MRCNMDYHTILGIIALLVGVAGYIPYIRDTLKGRTKPHPFTYGIQALVGSITVAAQLFKGAGPGAWAMALPVVFGIIVAALSITKGERALTRRDWYCLGGALVAIVVWRLTSDALYAVLTVIVVNTLAMIPTFEKANLRPNEETASSYALGVVRSIISVPALDAFNAVTLLPLVHHILMNSALVALLLTRRRQLK